MVAVVIPCYKVKNQILSVINRIGAEVDRIYVIDDCCPQQSGLYVQENSSDPRIKIIFHEKNQGVGGALITGYKAAIAEDVQIVIKIDGDGQMDPSLIPSFIGPIRKGDADYTKGNRFFDMEYLFAMPKIRLIGNSALSFINKAVSGYWNIMDPTNGYTAISGDCLRMLQLDKIEKRYFFESDMLFRLSIIRAVVKDIPMKAHYSDEESSLRVSKVLIEFPAKYATRFFKRIFYNYFLRDFNVGTLELLTSFSLLTFGTIFGVQHWRRSLYEHSVASSGTVMLSALPIIIGIQTLLAVISYDVNSVPTIPITRSTTN